jgi:hypothetical protein
VIEQSGDMTAAFSSALESASTPVADASPASTPTTDPTPTETTPAAAIAQPEGQEQPPASVSTEPDKTEGEPPKWRWQDILANARETSAKEAEARVRQEIEQRYAGLQDFASIAQQERQGLLVWRAALNGDQNAIAQIKAHPEARAALQQLLGEQAATQADVEPEADLQAADGTLVYSAQQQKKWQDWNSRQLTQKLTQQFTQQFSPLQRLAQQQQQREEAERKQAEHEQWATDVFAPIKRLPFFEELKPEIAKALAASTDQKLDANGLRNFVWDTYATLHAAKLDSQSKQSESKVLANLQQRVVAGSVSPSSTGATSAPKRFQSGQQGFEDALRHFSAVEAR